MCGKSTLRCSSHSRSSWAATGAGTSCPATPSAGAAPSHSLHLRAQSQGQAVCMHASVSMACAAAHSANARGGKQTLTPDQRLLPGAAARGCALGAEKAVDLDARSMLLRPRAPHHCVRLPSPPSVLPAGMLPWLGLCEATNRDRLCPP